MKKSKILSFVLSGLMAVTAVGTVTAGAEEAETKYYGHFNINDVSAENVRVTTDIQKREEYLNATEPVSMLVKDYYDSCGSRIGHDLYYRNDYYFTGEVAFNAKTSTRARWDYIQERTALGDTVTYYPHLWRPAELTTGFTREDLENVTEPIMISVFEHQMLTEENERIKALYPLYREIGIEALPDERSQQLYLQRLEALKSFEDAGTTMIITPGEHFDSYEEIDFSDRINTYDALLTGNSGTFDSGVTYRFNEETKGLFFEGSGQLAKSDFDAAFDTFEFDFMYFGKDVILPDDYEGTEFNPIIGWTMRDEYDDPIIPIYTHLDSDFAKEYESSLKYLCRYVDESEIDAAMDDLKEQYRYYTIGVNYDLDTIVHEHENYEPDVSEYEHNYIVELDRETLTYVGYDYQYKDKIGQLIITANGEKIIDVKQVVDAVKHLDIDVVYLVTKTECYSDELAAFETKEEAEAYLLECINNAKKSSDKVVVDPTYMTVLGDIDLDDTQGMSDIVTLTKFNASASLYPLSDKTAIANADMNQDGKIDAVDTSILIEMALGDFASAVE